MKTLSIMAQKGGAGKTTLAVHLAVLAQQQGNTVALVDIDPQQSAFDWWQTRQQKTPIMVEAAATQLAAIKESASNDGIDYLMIDTPPHATHEAEIACSLADFIVIPCRPSVLDLRAIGKTIKLVQNTGKKAGVVLNHCPPGRGILGEVGIVTEARETLQNSGIPVCPVAISQRVAFSHALIDGRSVTEFEPNGKAAKEIYRLFQWIEEQTA
jgi:chromosome partitioning protein